MKWLKKNIITILLMLIFAAGLCLMLYPTFSDYWNSFHQSKAISDYVESVARIDEGKYQEILMEAEEYNRSLVGNDYFENCVSVDDVEYNTLLNVDGSGIMGYVEIPSISCTLPIYHGTDAGVLQIAAGHLEGTSLPIGGEDTHCVISGHRGLPSAKLFSDIDRLVEGDIFQLRVLDEVLTYEVDKISIVLPDEFEELEILRGKDLCTLVTCTPYGINTHRLLVRGHRIETEKEKVSVRVTADAQTIDPLVVAPVVAAPMLLLLLIVVLLPNKKKKAVQGMVEELREEKKE